MKRRVLAGALVVLTLFGGAVATASTATAGGASGCCRAVR